MTIATCSLLFLILEALIKMKLDPYAIPQLQGTERGKVEKNNSYSQQLDFNLLNLNSH